jgi:mevalonate kinase
MTTWRRFQTEVPAKWVLAGEHSVLRGGTAILLPHSELSLQLSFEPDESISPLRILPPSTEGIVRDVLHAIADRWEDEGRSLTQARGTLRIDSTIPVGAGLGSSAAFSVALAKWMKEPLALESGAVFEFAKDLEHRFHGRSSGMDVAVALAGEPISFNSERGFQPLGLKKLPHFSFHDTGLRARTSECVYRVGMLREENPHLALEIDEAMGLAVREAMEGLVHFERGQTERGLEHIAQGMNQAQQCFYSWMLIPGEARRLEENLLAQGALAVKITGAGGGGMLVALWKDTGQQE